MARIQCFLTPPALSLLQLLAWASCVWCCHQVPLLLLLPKHLFAAQTHWYSPSADFHSPSRPQPECQAAQQYHHYIISYQCRFITLSSLPTTAILPYHNTRKWNYISMEINMYYVKSIKFYTITSVTKYRWNHANLKIHLASKLSVLSNIHT